MQIISLQTFFEKKLNVYIRAQIIDNEPWFVAKDICLALDIKNSRDTTKKVLDKDEYRKYNIRTESSNGVSQIRNITFINESGLYHLIFLSRKRNSEIFRIWLTKTVLPTLRKIDKYNIPSYLSQK